MSVLIKPSYPPHVEGMTSAEAKQLNSPHKHSFANNSNMK